MAALLVLTVAPMKFRTFIIPLALAAGLILVLGVGLLGGLALRTPLYLLDRGGQAVPEALQFVPKQSALVASVLARPDRLAQLWDYLAEPSRRQSLRADRERIERAFLAQTGLTYERDIRPWLGEEITAALVTPDLDQDPGNGNTPGYLVALSCQDVTQAQATLELFWQNRALAGEPLTFEDLGGAHLIYGRTSASASGFSPLATALVAKRFVLVANDPAVLRQAIAAAQAVDGSMKTDRRYKLAFSALPQTRVGLLAVNLAQVERWLHPSPADSLLGQAPRFSEVAPLGWGLISLGLQRQGVMAEAAWVVESGYRLSPHQRRLTDWYRLARYLPGSLSLEALGLDLADLEPQLRPWVKPWVGSGTSLALSQTIDDRLGTGITDKILASTDQAYALGLDLPANASPPQWLLASPSSPPILDLIDTLGQQAASYGLGTGRLDILGYPTTVWTRLSLRQGIPGSRSGPLQVQTEVAGLSAEVGRDQVLTTSPEMMEQALAVDQNQAAPPEWTEQIPAFSQPGENYVHLDWLSLAAYLRQQVPQFRLWETLAQPALKHLRAITLASYGQTEQVHRDGILIQLQNP